MTTKTITIFALIALCALSAEAKKVTGNGNVITKEVSVNEYDAVSIGSNIVGQSDSWFSLFTQMGDKSYTFYYSSFGFRIKPLERILVVPQVFCRFL